MIDCFSLARHFVAGSFRRKKIVAMKVYVWAEIVDLWNPLCLSYVLETFSLSRSEKTMIGSRPQYQGKILRAWAYHSASLWDRRESTLKQIQDTRIAVYIIIFFLGLKMCQTNTLFDRTCSDKINTVFPWKEAQASISYRVVKIKKKMDKPGFEPGFLWLKTIRLPNEPSRPLFVTCNTLLFYFKLLFE